MSFFDFIRGTRENSFGIGDGTNSDKRLEAAIPGANPPVLRFNHTTAKWEISHDGTIFIELNAGIVTVANAAALPAGVVGKVAFQADVLALRVCTGV